MSRIGKEPITVPADIKVDIKGQKISVSGKNGKLEREVLPELQISMKDQEIIVENRDNSKRTNAFRGLTRSLINNMVPLSSISFPKAPRFVIITFVRLIN